MKTPNISAISEGRTYLRREIRAMDKLMRHSNNAYPRISPYRVLHMSSHLPIAPHHTMWLYRLFQIVSNDRSIARDKALLNNFIYGTKFVKYSKLGDCEEATDIMMSSLIANGYRDGIIAHLLFETEKKNLKTNQIIEKGLINTTHEFIVRNLSQNAESSNPKTYGRDLIVIDAWDGFCGNLQESLKRFYETFLQGKRKLIVKDNEIEVRYRPIFYFHNNKEEYTSQDTEILKTLFPELISK